MTQALATYSLTAAFELGFFVMQNDGGMSKSAEAPPPLSSVKRPVRRRRFRGLILLLFLVVATSAIIRWPFLLDPLRQWPWIDSALTQVEGGIARLKDALPRKEAELAESEPSPATNEPPDSGMAERLASDSARLDAIERAVSGAAEKNALAGLEARLATLEQSLGQVTASLAQAAPAATSDPGATPPEASDAVAAFAARLAVLEKAALGSQVANIAALDRRLAAVETTFGQAADRNAVSAIDERLARLEADESGNTLRHAVAVLALTALARAASESHPFKVQLDAMKALAPREPGLMELEQFAESGTPTLSILAGRFPDAASAALDADRLSTAGEGILGRLWFNLTNLVRIRRIGDPDGATNADKLARAESDLAQGNLDPAIAEIRALNGDAAKPMSAWLESAEARQRVDATIARIETRIAGALTGASQTAPNHEPDAQIPAPEETIEQPDQNRQGDPP